MSLRAVLFDWGDTLFHAPHAPAVIVEFAESHGVHLSETRARELWDEVWLEGKTPEEIAKGGILAAAHRRVWRRSSAAWTVSFLCRPRCTSG